MKLDVEDLPIAGARFRPFKAAVMFCGAGGDTAGLDDCCEELNLNLDLTGVNHWPRACATYKLNFPKARNFCASVDALNPRHLYKEGELKYLWASPECTHHSNARGGKPINDQSRATAWCVVRWIEALHPDFVHVENVREFMNWAPLIRRRVKFVWRPDFERWRKRRCPKLKVGEARKRWKRLRGELRSQLAWVPDPKRKGEVFRAWVAAIESAGYRVDHRVLCCADYGDPTTRERLFIHCVRKASRKKIVWPNPTHAEFPTDDLFGRRSPWCTARDHVIDWSLPGKSIFERPIPHADNTLRRIFIGFLRGLESADLSTLTIGQQSGAEARPDGKPVATVPGRGALGIATPRLVKLKGTNTTAKVDKPSPSVTCAPYLGVMQPQMLQVNHGKDGGKSDSHRIKPVNKPMNSVTGTRGDALVEFVIQTDQSGGNGACVRPTDKPTTAVVTKANLALGVAKLKEYIVGAGGPERAGEPKSVDRPLNPVLTRNTKALIVPKLEPPPFNVPPEGPLPASFISRFHGSKDKKHPAHRTHKVGKPMPCIDGSNRYAVIESKLTQEYLVNMKGKSNDAPADKPTPALTAHATNLGVAEPVLQFILPREGINKGNASRSTRRPFHTITTHQNAGGLVEAKFDPRGKKEHRFSQVIKFYGTGVSKPVTLPIDTVTTKERFAVVEFLITQVKKKNRPLIEINGHVFCLDILFRMFTWYELARAQSFREGYQFTGSVEEVVKQIGNAVPRKTVRALIKACLTQNPNV